MIRVCFAVQMLHVMDKSNDQSVKNTTARSCVGGAGGVAEKRQWFVAIVNHNTEKAVGERLERLGVESYVASQCEMRVWRNGRKAKVNRVVIPSTVFVKCSESERRHIVTLPYINRFMTDKAGTHALQRQPLAVIPDGQIETLRFMLGNSDTPVTMTDSFCKGDRVRVIRGGLRGLEGEVVNSAGANSELIVRIDFFGCARLTIDPINVEPVR